jgi:NAD(P)H-dependent FMN reductase
MAQGSRTVHRRIPGRALLARVGTHHEITPLAGKTDLNPDQSIQITRIEGINMEASRPLFIPVLLGTTRQGRQSLHAAKLITQQLCGRAGVKTELIDIASLPLPTNDAGEAIKNAEFSATIDRADGLVIVAPEYNHGYSGLLKHVLDSCLKEYIHKAVGIAGVSASTFGGTRMIENLIPVMRELGMVTIFWDVNFSNVQNVFASDGKLLDESFIRRIDKFLQELIWMSRTLRYGREQVPLD